MQVPGSKSLTNRALLLAALAQGSSALVGALRSDDTDRLGRALGLLGVEIATVGDRITVQGAAGRLVARGEPTLDLGDGGTPARFMLAAAALATAPVVIDGSARLRERPFADGIALLRALGVQIECLRAEGQLPVRVVPGAAAPVGGTLIAGQVASSQFLSALLLVAPWFRDGLTLELREPPTSEAYLGLTIDELRRWGAQVEQSHGADGSLARVRVAPGALAPRPQAHIEADASSAVYWAAAAALVPGSQIELTGLPGDSRQPDMGAIAALETMGARVERAADRVRVAWQGPAAGPALRGISLDASGFPDGALAVAAAAAAATGPTRLRGLQTLRVKESDRLAAMQAELVRVGAGARVEGDALLIEPPASLAPHGVRVQTYRDHRIAMSFAVLGLRTGGLLIQDPGCVQKSYPGFWRDLERLRTGGAHAMRPEARPFA